MRYLLLILFTLNSLTLVAQKLKPTSLNDFVTECLKSNGEMPHKQMVIWFPSNYWQITGEQMNISPGSINKIVSEMSKYMMFTVVDYEITSTGINYKTDEDIRKSIRLYDSSKVVYYPIDMKNISPTATELLKSLQPVMAQMLGQFGQGMRIFLFEAKQVNGKPVIDITKTNHFSLSWDDINLKWTLPFASILPPKFCPVDNEKMKGNWSFCPVHGVRLDQ